MSGRIVAPVPLIPVSLLGADVTHRPVARTGADIRDAVVRHAGVRRMLVASRRSAWVDVPGVARFTITGGRAVVIDAAPDAWDDDIALWLFGTVATLLLGQQGRFALHASTVALPGTAVALCGRSGSGKSTTSLALVGRGHRLVADDVSPVTVSGLAASVEPFGRPNHVWPATYDALGETPPLGARCRPSSAKLLVPVPLGAIAALGATVVIRTNDDASAVTTNPVPRAAAVRALVGQTYRGTLVKRLWPTELLRFCAGLADVIPTVEVIRPATGWTAPAVADAVEQIAARAVEI